VELHFLIFFNFVLFLILFSNLHIHIPELCFMWHLALLFEMCSQEKIIKFLEAFSQLMV